MAGGKAAEYRKEGRPAFVEDEAGVQISQNPSYGWRPTNGRDTFPIGFSTKSVRLIGIIEIMRSSGHNDPITWPEKLQVSVML